jgi:hypothetical protein
MKWLKKKEFFMTNVRTFKPEVYKWGMCGQVCSMTANIGFRKKITCDLLE